MGSLFDQAEPSRDQERRYERPVHPVSAEPVPGLEVRVDPEAVADGHRGESIRRVTEGDDVACAIACRGCDCETVSAENDRPRAPDRSSMGIRLSCGNREKVATFLEENGAGRRVETGLVQVQLRNVSSHPVGEKALRTVSAFYDMHGNVQ